MRKTIGCVRDTVLALIIVLPIAEPIWAQIDESTARYPAATRQYPTEYIGDRSSMSFAQRVFSTTAYPSDKSPESSAFALYIIQDDILHRLSEIGLGRAAVVDFAVRTRSRWGAGRAPMPIFF